MTNNKGIDTSTKIAPKIGSRASWTVQEWIDAQNDSDWEKMLLIFSDRVNGRYLNFIKSLKEQPYSGFAVIALGCALIETLHQFYKGLENSDNAIWDCGHKMNNSEFYTQFLTHSSFAFKNHFLEESHAVLFYKHFRCGLAHQAETKSDSKIRRKNGSILFETTKGGLIVYREKFVDLLDEEIKSYIKHLKADDIPNLRKSFIKKMNHICRLPSEEIEN